MDHERIGKVAKLLSSGKIGLEQKQVINGHYVMIV